MDSNYHWLITTALVVSSVIAITANSFLLIVFCRRRGLRTVPNRFVINLLITNLLSSILLIPLLLTDQELILTSNSTQVNTTYKEIEKIVIEEEIVNDSYQTENNFEFIKTSEKILTETFESNNNKLLLCYFAQSSTSFVSTASIFSILLIGINQYFGVIHSLRYHFYINKCKSTIFILSSWLISLVCSILGSLTYSDSSLWHFCQKTRQTSEIIKIFNTVYAFSYFVVVILAPFVAICVIYVCIYTAAHKNSERMRKSTSSNANLDYMQVPTEQERLSKSVLPKVHSAPNFSHLTKQSTFIDIEVKESGVKVHRTCSDRNTNNFISTLKHKISNASVFRYREETRAAKISVLVIFLVLICYVPYGATLVLNCDYIQIKPSQILNYLSLILLILSNILSPFLFGYRNKRIKREIGKMFGLIQTQNQNKISVLDRPKRQTVLVKNRSFEDIHENFENNEPFLAVPEVVVTCKPENERKSILKKYTSGWTNYKKCNFITVPDSCISGEARGSFSSASTQISSEE